jgi:M6 family metalloprotease-like protein
MIRKITFTLLAGLLFGLAQQVSAIPAVPLLVEKIQPDGSKISVYLRGDEKVHWMESIDGYTLMYDADKYIVYAEQDADHNMIPSKNKLTPLSIAPQNLKKNIRYSPSQIKTLEQIWNITNNESPQRAGATTGPRQALVVLIGFTDKPITKSKAEFETLFNQEGLYNATTKGSVRDFFKENSYGKLDLTVTIAGPYVAPNTCKYYADQSHWRDFAAAAARAADSDINFNDFADNGVLETFHIIFAGYGDEAKQDGNQIWSHKSGIQPITLDGVRISTYSCSPELQGGSGSNITHIGVICHELTHVFGAPDYYDTDYSGFTGSGEWDLMAGGSWNDNGRQPAHINIFQKILFGWLTPTPLTSPTEITAMPPSALNPVAYIIEANTNGEAYILDNRQQVGFDASLRGHGLLIWHVHPSAWNGNASNDGHPQQLYPVVAASTTAIPNATPTSYGDINSPGTPFPGTTRKYSFTARTTPAMFTWTNLQTIAKPITEISEATNQTISFKFMADPAAPVTNLRSEVSGGTVTLTWTAPTQDAILGYEIYRDGTLLYTIRNGATTTYTQTNVSNGAYLYGVSALYETTQSETVTVNVTVNSGSDTYYFPISNLKASATFDQVSLTWDEPYSGGWMTIAGSPHFLYSFNSTFTFFAGTLWEPKHLKGLNGYEVSRIQFYRYVTDPGITYKAQIWEIDASGTPVLVRTQDYSDTSIGDKIIILNEPVVIDASKEYIIGVEIHTIAETICFATDNDPIVPQRNWICEDNAWFSMEDLGFENNFYTSVYLTPGTSSAPPVILDSRTQQVSASPASAFLSKTKTQPSHLIASKTGKTLSLDASPQKAAATLTRYAIYRDGEKIAETPDRSYTDNGRTSGTSYAYCVSALYSDGAASEGICIEQSTLATVNPYKPAEDFHATLTGNNVTLQWEKPFAGGPFGYITATNNLPAYNLTGIMALRFSPEELKRMYGMKLTQVSFAVYSTVNTTNTSYYLRIYTGGNGNEPGPSICRQFISSFRGGGWNTVDLTVPVDINVYEDLWIGLEVVALGRQPAAVPRMSCDTGPAVDGKGNLLYLDGRWTTLSAAGGGDYNWSILPRIEGGAPEYSTPNNYRITRNGSEIATVGNDQFTYTDVLSANGRYTYGITARYADNNISDTQTAGITYEGVGIPTVDQARHLTVYPNPTRSGQTFSVQTDTPGALLRVHSLSGTLMQQQPATGTLTTMQLWLPPGIYILSAGEEKIKIAVQ